MAAESAGIPSVSIVCDGFQGQATATARGHGYDGLPVVATIGHVDAQSADEMVGNFTRPTVDQIIAGLLGGGGSADGSAAAHSPGDDRTAHDAEPAAQ